MAEINAIAEVLLDPKLADRLDGSIPIEIIKTWLHSDDVEVLGAMYVFLSEQRFFRLSEETLAFDDYFEFLERYFRICLVHNPDGEWSDSRYTAARDIVNWIGAWKTDENIPAAKVQEFLDSLKRIYARGDADTRLCMEVAVFEPLETDS